MRMDTTALAALCARSATVALVLTAAIVVTALAIPG
jgi:hypothetical protein